MILSFCLTSPFVFNRKKSCRFECVIVCSSFCERTQYLQYLQRHNETLTPFTVFVTPPLQPWITWLCLTAGMWHISCHTHTHSLSDARLYMHTDGPHFGGRDSVCRIGGGGGGSSAGVGGLMFDWVSFVLLHTHGYNTDSQLTHSLKHPYWLLQTHCYYINLTSYFFWLSEPSCAHIKGIML